MVANIQYAALTNHGPIFVAQITLGQKQVTREKRKRTTAKKARKAQKKAAKAAIEEIKDDKTKKSETETKMTRIILKSCLPTITRNKSMTTMISQDKLLYRSLFD